MITPGCACCDCAACTHCDSGTKPVRWVFSMSGVANGTACGCTAPVTSDCTRYDGDYIISCNNASPACDWGNSIPEFIPHRCSNGSPSSVPNLSYSGGAFYLTFGDALYKYTAASHDCSTPMTLTYSTDFGYPTSTCCTYPGSITLTPG